MAGAKTRVYTIRFSLHAGFSYFSFVLDKSVGFVHGEYKLSLCVSGRKIPLRRVSTLVATCQRGAPTKVYYCKIIFAELNKNKRRDKDNNNKKLTHEPKYTFV